MTIALLQEFGLRIMELFWQAPVTLKCMHWPQVNPQNYSCYVKASCQINVDYGKICCNHVCADSCRPHTSSSALRGAQALVLQAAGRSPASKAAGMVVRAKHAAKQRPFVPMQDRVRREPISMDRWQDKIYEPNSAEGLPLVQGSLHSSGV